MGFFHNTRAEDGSYTPPMMHRLLAPKVSGNALNGLGETDVRRPSPIYHHRKANYPHGKLQLFFNLSAMAGFLFNPAQRAFFRRLMKVMNLPLDPVAETAVRDSPENWSAELKNRVLANAVDQVGIARIDPNWVFDGYEVPKSPWVVIFAIGQEYSTMIKMVDEGRDKNAAQHIGEIYGKCTEVAVEVSNWIRAQGYDAEPCRGGEARELILIPGAIQVGIGELGKHGSLINRELGSNFRLGYIITDMPLVEDNAPDDFGVDDFCTNCQLCMDYCPPDAIFADKQLVRGARKWYVDFDKCVPYFNDAYACGICLAICPWSRPGVAPKLVEKMQRRRARAGNGQGLE